VRDHQIVREPPGKAFIVSEFAFRAGHFGLMGNKSDISGRGREQWLVQQGAIAAASGEFRSAAARIVACVQLL
jgi:hypothetical protein